MAGPCEVWELDDSCVDIPNGTPQEVIDRWQAVATELLWAASGRRAGLCEVTVRPCLRHCDGGVAFAWGPYKGMDGEWRNFATCGCVGDCSCVELCEIVLEGPVDSVVQILIGEDELMQENFRLDLVGGEYRLLRTDGGCWDACSDITAECGTIGAFCVTYMKGIAPSDLAIAAVSELTSELIKACDASCRTCRLPKNVTQVVRRGVAITFESGMTWLKSLPLVAAFIDTVNPEGLSSQSTVWSPDISAVRTTPTPQGS